MWPWPRHLGRGRWKNIPWCSWLQWRLFLFITLSIYKVKSILFLYTKSFNQEGEWKIKLICCHQDIGSPAVSGDSTLGTRHYAAKQKESPQALPGNHQEQVFFLSLCGRCLYSQNRLKTMLIPWYLTLYILNENEYKTQKSLDRFWATLKCGNKY